MNSLNHVAGKVIVKVWMEEKNYHTFENGQRIRLERNIENLDIKYTRISQGEVVDSEYLPQGAVVLFHPNQIHDTNRIFNYGSLSGSDIASEIHYYSISEHSIYLYREGDGSYKPLRGYATALRVYKPYTGILQGISPKKIENVLWVTSGELKGKVVYTVVAADYTLIFQENNGREGQVIRFRPFGNIKENREEEAIAIFHDLTDKVINGEYLVGISVSDAKKINEYERDMEGNPRLRGGVLCK